MLSDKQKESLSAPLNSDAVKTRQQSGRNLSYIEGWHAIAEANRIFGFDGWSRETLDISCVSERERKIGKNNRPGWGVTYTARVRVVVNAIARDGCGAGHGIDADCGLAHESAIKEAETDAMKRALMTFGNPFGLALYDKQQENVQDPKDAERAEQARAKQDSWAASKHGGQTVDIVKLGIRAAEKQHSAFIALARTAPDMDALNRVKSENDGYLQFMENNNYGMYKEILKVMGDRMDELLKNGSEGQ